MEINRKNGIVETKQRRFYDEMVEKYTFFYQEIFQLKNTPKYF